MVFSSRNKNLPFNFDFEVASLRDVELHKHLGVIFSNDCKWTKHIDKLIIPSRFFVNRCYANVTGKTTNNTSASVCTFSKRFKLNWPQLNQTSDAYSKIGLINVK
jgi:hypothetical protein